MVPIENTRVEKQRARLIKLLKELFQLDQPDLDFGFYRIMHAKAEMVSDFLQNDLLKIIHEAFGQADDARVEEARLSYEAAVKQAAEYGAPDPEATEPVRKAKASYEAVKDIGTNEGEIYEHLYRFFERYYDNGDFMSRRYFARETEGKAATYSVPYDGREVYLHWANRDQYYIKTSEYLANFTFDLSQAPELKGQLFEQQSKKIHCRIVEASEGEHSNVKANDKTERFFLIHQAEPVKIENGELVLQFEYRPDPVKSGTYSKWQEKRIDEAEEKILHALTGLRDAESFNQALRTQIGDENKRSLLRKYINRYTARNTMDYFIHKDLGGFLKRELDFYIKNEIMRLDDIESADAPRVESYLSKIRVLRKIAGHLITFLAQLEEFQKKLWLKKKFVTETQYCITLDRIPESFYVEIVSNEAQREEWISLYAIDELEEYSTPLTIDFLKAHPFMMLDSAFFADTFKDRLLAEIQDLDETMDGLLIHSENFQALSLLQNKYEKCIQCVYIDPPYNTVHSEIIYKNQYKHSTWLSLIGNGLPLVKNLWTDDFSFGVAIDDYEHAKLSAMLETTFPALDKHTVIVNHHPQGSGGRLSRTHEYFILLSAESGPRYLGKPKEDEQEDRSFMRSGTADNNYRVGRNDPSKGRWKSFYALLIDPMTKRIIDAEEPVPIGTEYPTGLTEKGYIRKYPINSRGEERVWRSSYETGKKRAINGELIITDSGTVYQQIEHQDKRETLFSTWIGSEFNAGTRGSGLLSDMGLGTEFDYPKSIGTLETAIGAQSFGKTDSIILDYFAGSATTGHAAININRDTSNAKLKYILVEMGNYFDDVTRPRVQKAVYSSDWKDGKPLFRDGISHTFKYIRLESYEDALNNLAFQDNSKRDEALAHSDEFRRDYMLKYWIDFETKGSPSLLNIELFSDPTSYKLNIKKPGSDEYEEKSVDLIETFNWLIGLHVDHVDTWRTYTASFKREEDPELPKDENTRLILDSRMEESTSGKWWFRKVEGRVCRTPGDKTNMDRVLIIWRKLTGNLEEDNLMLDEWFKKYRLSTQDTEFDVIYVNGSNNLPNLRQDDEYWKVRLIEETFHQKMWDAQGQ